MKFLFSQSDSEKRASIAGMNLFFSVVLGANLGSVSSLDLYDYVLLLILLGGSVMAIFIVAASRRRMIVLSTLAVYGTVLGAMAAVPEFRPDRMEDEILRIIVTFAVWVALLFMVKLAPLADEPNGPAASTSAATSDAAADVIVGAPPLRSAEGAT
jgi:hypothetical protein